MKYQDVQKLSLILTKKKRLLKDCWDEISEGIGKNEKVSLSQDIIDGLIGSLYEYIGHLDYRMYYNVDDDISDEQKLENIKAYLVNRAYKSAMLEAFEDEANKNGFIIKKKFKLKDITSEELRNRYGDDIFHGTVAEVKPEELGEVDENGKYKIRDGILYFTQRERAEKFVNKMKNSHPDITQEPWIYARDISQSYKDNECVKLDNGILTTGWTGYLYQDEVKQLCKEGKKYVFSGTPQILDIHNFAKFVEERDTAILGALEKYKLRLPSPKESLTEYITALGITEQQFEDIISAEKKRANEQRWSTGKVLPNNREKSTQQLGKETLEELKDTVLLDEIEHAQEIEERAITSQRESQNK